MGGELKYGGGVVVPFMRQAAKNQAALANGSYGYVKGVTVIDGGVMLTLSSHIGYETEAVFLWDHTARVCGVYPITAGNELIYKATDLDNEAGALAGFRQIAVCMPARSAAIAPRPRP